MKVQYINSKSFEAKKLRLPIQIGDELYIREYTNPDAKKIYKEAKQIKNPFEQGQKLAEMGNYELVSFNSIEKLKMFFGKIKKDFLWLIK